MKENAIHIHEDDWGMRNLYPLAALPDVAADVEGAAKKSERNRATDGIGWTDVHLIQPPATGYAAVGLDLDAVASAIERFMPRVRRFTATAGAGFGTNVRDPWGSYEQDAHCYGSTRPASSRWT